VVEQLHDVDVRIVGRIGSKSPGYMSWR